MLINVKNYPRLLTQDEIINLYYQNDSKIKNIVLEIIKERPDKIFFEIIFESILDSKLKKNSLEALHRLPRIFSQKKLKLILENPKSDRYTLVEILKFGNTIFDKTYINQLLLF